MTFFGGMTAVDGLEMIGVDIVEWLEFSRLKDLRRDFMVDVHVEGDSEGRNRVSEGGEYVRVVRHGRRGCS